MSTDRSLLLEIARLLDRGWIHEGLPPEEALAVGFESKFFGTLFERDDAGHWRSRKSASVRFWQSECVTADAGSLKPIFGWVDRENHDVADLCLALPTDFSTAIIDRVSSALARKATCSLEFRLSFKEEFRTGEKTGEYFTAVYFCSPSSRDADENA
jgi:hypothetical protein